MKCHHSWSERTWKCFKCGVYINPETGTEEMKNPINKITADDVGLFSENIDQHEGGTLDNYQAVATKSAFYPGQGSALGLLYCALKLNGEAGELAEHVGKAMRDDALTPMGEDELGNPVAYFCELEPERRALIIKEIGDNLWYLSAICNELGIKLSDAALINLEKLYDRGNRNKLSGSGDER